MNGATKRAIEQTKATKAKGLTGMEACKNLIAAAREWLSVEQSDAAILSHHGISCGEVLLRCKVRLAPVGFAWLPVFIFDIAKPKYRPDGQLINPFTLPEIEAIERMLKSAGVDILNEWNGTGYITGSFLHSRPCGPTLRAAIDRYQSGCPAHLGEGVFCHCDWLKNGHNVLRLPEKWS